MNLDDPQTTELAINGAAPARAHPIEGTVHVSALARSRVSPLLDSGAVAVYYKGACARQLENEFAQYHGPEFRAVAVNSGTSALQLAVSAAGIGPGDEWIVPALCFVAAAIAVVQNGAIPV